LFEQAKEQIFKVDNRITVNEVMRDQFETFLRKQAIYEENWLGYKEEVKTILAQTKDQFNEDFKETLK
jgi:hypothetical protein